MKKIAAFLALAAAAGAAGLIPFPSSDVAELLPVEILCVTSHDGGVTVAADGGLTATGETVAQALESLRDSAEGELFLGTVDYVTVSGSEAVPAAELMACSVRPAAEICRVEGTPSSPEELLAYLSSHSGGMNLGEAAEGGGDLPLLLSDGGGWRMKSQGSYR